MNESGSGIIIGPVIIPGWLFESGGEVGKRIKGKVVIIDDNYKRRGEYVHMYILVLYSLHSTACIPSFLLDWVSLI